MCGTEAESIVDSILRLPPGTAACVDLVDVSIIDQVAAAALANAVRHQSAQGVELSIVVGTDAVEIPLHAVGLETFTIRRPDARPA